MRGKGRPMSFVQAAFGRFKQTVTAYAGDEPLMKAAVSACANVIVADGEVAGAEFETALKGMLADPVLEKGYDSLMLEEELYDAIGRARTRAGRMQNMHFIEAWPSAGRAAPERLPHRRRRRGFRGHQPLRAPGPDRGGGGPRARPGRAARLIGHTNPIDCFAMRISAFAQAPRRLVIWDPEAIFRTHITRPGSRSAGRR